MGKKGQIPLAPRPTKREIQRYLKERDAWFLAVG
jgi:hypothetical protein